MAFELEAVFGLRILKGAEHLAGLKTLRLRALARRRAPKRTPHVAGLQTSPPHKARRSQWQYRGRHPKRGKGTTAHHLWRQVLPLDV